MGDLLSSASALDSRHCRSLRHHRDCCSVSAAAWVAAVPATVMELLCLVISVSFDTELIHRSFWPPPELLLGRFEIAAASAVYAAAKLCGAVLRNCRWF
ncbi:uncharacterized protein DS421_3g84230 [Arachis hypogaea]|nr:uncharacterized protein DS421_3g84230 [Arachis hypogaea]